ncbi:MAG: hypothetical protein PHQ40_00820 [Anaerolineaceae bacterium]|nr:hypothetical protein [Anaerolineaceae bacterium]
MPLSSDQFAEFETRLKNELPDHIVAVEYDEDAEGQGTIAVEIKDVAWQYYVTGICRTILREILEEPFSVSLLVIPVARIGESEGLFGLTYRGGVNSFFIHYYAPERQRNKPFTVPVYYRKLIDVLRIIPTKKGPSLENAEAIWNRLFSTSYEVLARQQGIHTFTASNLAARLRQFLIDVIDEIKEIAESKGDRIALISSVHRPPVKVSIDKTSYQGKGYQIASQLPAIVWVSPHIISERIDAHPFQPSFIQIDEMLAERADSVRLGEKIRQEGGLAGGATPLGAIYLKEGIRFIRSQNIAPNWIDLSDVVYISPEDHQILERSVLETDDLLLTITGSFTSAVVYPECLPANISQHSVKVHFNEDINPRFVSAYLNSKYGQAQIQQQQVGLTRPAIDYDGVKALRLPLPDRRIQDFIGEKIHLAEKCRLHARSLWVGSQEILSDALQLTLYGDYFEELEITQLQSQDYWLVEKRPVSIWVQREIVEHKLGPQYFHPRRMNVISRLQSTKVPLDRLSIIAPRQSDRKLDSEFDVLPFIGLADIDGQTGYFDLSTLAGLKDASAARIFQKGDVLISRLRPNLNKVSVCPPYLDKASGSTELMVYRPNQQIPAFYLFFVVKSNLALYQIVDVTVGSTLPRVDPDVIDDLLIPRIGVDRENKIDEEVRRMFWLLNKASYLLLQANQDVYALLEDRLNSQSILDGHLQSPTWEEVLHDVEASLAA